MPTGYTSIINDNPDVPFDAFVWRCARAFGALVMMREECIDAKVPEELHPAPYYRESVARAEEKLTAARALTHELASVAMAEEARAIEVENAKRREEHAAELAGYERMRAAAEAWIPPTSEHDGLRRFMLEQLQTGHPGYEPYQSQPPTGDVASYIADRIASAERSLEYSKQSLRDEEERTRSRNAWLRALRESVPMPKDEP